MKVCGNVREKEERKRVSDKQEWERPCVCERVHECVYVRVPKCVENSFSYNDLTHRDNNLGIDCWFASSSKWNPTDASLGKILFSNKHLLNSWVCHFLLFNKKDFFFFTIWPIVCNIQVLDSAIDINIIFIDETTVPAKKM